MKLSKYKIAFLDLSMVGKIMIHHLFSSLRYTSELIILVDIITRFLSKLVYLMVIFVLQLYYFNTNLLISFEIENDIYGYFLAYSL